MPEFEGKSGGGPFKMKYKKSAFPFYSKPSPTKRINVEAITQAAESAHERLDESGIAETYAEAIKEAAESISGMSPERKKELQEFFEGRGSGQGATSGRVRIGSVPSGGGSEK